MFNVKHILTHRSFSTLFSNTATRLSWFTNPSISNLRIPTLFPLLQTILCENPPKKNVGQFRQ